MNAVPSTAAGGGQQRAGYDPATGNSRARQALKAGLVDDVVPQTIYWKQLSSWLKRTPAQRDITGPEREPPRPLGARCYFARCVKDGAKTQGTIRRRSGIDAIETGLAQAAVSKQTRKRALASWGDDAVIAGAARCFLASTEVKKIPVMMRRPARWNSVGILGGGLMGVAWPWPKAACQRIKDINTRSIML